MNDDEVDDETIARIRKNHASRGIGRGTRPIPPHGTYARVVHRREPCKPLCADCRRALADYRRKWRKTPAGKRSEERRQAARAAKRAEQKFRPDIRAYWREIKAMTASNRRNQ